MSNNKIYQQLIHTTRWLKLRHEIICKHPMCERCMSEGYYTPTTEVHHIVPVESAASYNEMVRLMYDPSNLRALCHSCHVKTHTEMGRCGKEANMKRNNDKIDKINRKFFGS